MDKVDHERAITAALKVARKALQADGPSAVDAIDKIIAILARTQPEGEKT